MTNMTDAQISRKLALAIGYRPEDVKVNKNGSVEVRRPLRPGAWPSEGWHLFSYTWASVIWRVAERFDCFPSKWDEDGPEAWQAWCDPKETFVYTDTAAKAVALAVIAAHGG